MPDGHPHILYLHSHDTGRYIQPYGHQVLTPNVQALADQGVIFRQAFCAAPTCSASRACLLTGQYTQTNGMMGLAHRGWSLRDYSHHIVHTLHDAGYSSVLIGEQHISKDPAAIGYDEVLKIPTTRVETVAPLAMEVLRREHDRPLFMSVGFFETHREFLGPGSLRDVHYSQVPANLPDTPEVRTDVAGFKASARSLDHGVGLVLYDLVFDPNEANNLVADPSYASILEDLRARLEEWMRGTDDPLLDGHVDPPPGVEVNDPDQRSASEPTMNR